MTERMKPILGAMVTAIIVNYIGVYYFYGPIAESAAPSGLELPRGVALMIAMVFFILFYDWVNQQVNHPIKSAMIVAVSQILLVDVYYVLAGQRPMMQAAASVVVLLIGWGAAGMVYGKLLDADSGAAA
jgi:hypothetical protein